MLARFAETISAPPRLRRSLHMAMGHLMAQHAQRARASRERFFKLKKAFDRKKEQAALEKRAQNRPMSRNEKRLADIAEQRRKLSMAKEQKDIAQKNIEEAARQKQIKAWADRLKVAKETRDLLKKNLQAAGG